MEQKDVANFLAHIRESRSYSKMHQEMLIRLTESDGKEQKILRVFASAVAEEPGGGGGPGQEQVCLAINDLFRMLRRRVPVLDAAAAVSLVASTSASASVPAACFVENVAHYLELRPEWHKQRPLVGWAKELQEYVRSGKMELERSARQLSRRGQPVEEFFGDLRFIGLLDSAEDARECTMRFLRWGRLDGGGGGGRGGGGGGDFYESAQLRELCLNMLRLLCAAAPSRLPESNVVRLISGLHSDWVWYGESELAVVLAALQACDVSKDRARSVLLNYRCVDSKALSQLITNTMSAATCAVPELSQVLAQFPLENELWVTLPKSPIEQVAWLIDDRGAPSCVRRWLDWARKSDGDFGNPFFMSKLRSFELRGASASLVPP